MRRLIVVLLLVSSCGEVPNPNVCCVTEAQCDDLGSPDLRPCKVGQACAPDHTCVASECETNTDCNDAAPVCRLGFCESTCVDDVDCAQVAGRTHCSPGGVCVGCADSSQCSGALAFCDEDEHVCRGCERDDECASGVCLEAQGTCAEEQNILYVGNGTDAGSCEKTSPCRTIGYAYSKVGISSRNVIRLTGGGVAADTGTIAVNVPLFIDGTNTSITKPPGNIPWLRIDSAGSVTLTGVTVLGVTDYADPSIRVGLLATLIVGPGSVLRGTSVVNQGSATVDRATVEAGVSCTNGSVTVRDSTFVGVEFLNQIESTGCGLAVRWSRFTNGDKMIAASGGGLVVVENNLFASTLEYADVLFIRSVMSGSVFRFNTVVNTVASDTGDGVALNCDSTVDVNNNIFAFRSQHPFTSVPGCLVKHSIIDDVALPLPTTPLDSSYQPFALLFVDPMGKDFHLKTQSPARMAADANATLGDDLEHQPRPRPANTSMDVGAFEAD